MNILNKIFGEMKGLLKTVLVSRLTMKYNKGDKVRLKEKFISPTFTIPEGAIVTITYRDRLMRTYDIEYENDTQWVTDVTEKDLLPL